MFEKEGALFVRPKLTRAGDGVPLPRSRRPLSELSRLWRANILFVCHDAGDELLYILVYSNHC